ncbi:MAG: hypothetical protein R6U29_06615, partial [Desulfosudaceae bacterium]
NMADNNDKSAVNGNGNSRDNDHPALGDEDREILEMTERTLEVPSSQDEETIDLDELMDDDENGLEVVDLTDDIHGDDDVLDLTEVADDDEVVELTETVDDDDEVVELTETADDDDVIDLVDETTESDEVLDLVDEADDDTDEDNDEDIIELTTAADDGQDIQELTEVAEEDDDVLDLTEPAESDDEVLDLTEAAESEEEDVLDLTEAAESEEEDVLDLTEAMAAEDDSIEVTEEASGVDDEIFDLEDVLDDFEDKETQTGSSVEESTAVTEQAAKEEELNLASSIISEDSFADEELLELTDDVAMIGDDDELIKMTETSELSVDDLDYQVQEEAFADEGAVRDETTTGADNEYEDILDLTDDSLFQEEADTATAEASEEVEQSEEAAGVASPVDEDFLEFTDTVELTDIEEDKSGPEEELEAEPSEFSESLDEALGTALDTSADSILEGEAQPTGRVSARVHNRREIEVPSDFNAETIHAWQESLKKQVVEAGADHISEQQLENALVKAIKETYSEKLEQMIQGAVEKAIQQEIEKLSKLVGDDS